MFVRDCGTGTRSSEGVSLLSLLSEEGRRWAGVVIVVVDAGTWVPASRSLRGYGGAVDILEESADDKRRDIRNLKVETAYDSLQSREGADMECWRRLGQ